MATTKRISWIAAAASSLLVACASLPEPTFKKYHFPGENVYVEPPPAGRRFVSLGVIRTRIDYSAMLQDKTEEELCRNYFNKAARDLLYRAKKKLKADAVMNVRSVVFYIDGKTELHKVPECSEDEGEGQILLQGEAIRWEEDAAPLGAPPRKKTGRG